ncbi:hypothetical protein [Dietzia cercidiphylli]|uniref:DUF1330 domain-containing protein n=1 Tax=Dietzia cercidiphylli TaxID=498199 RepID=A0ABN2J8C7_9ACTN|nr:hypothetical protein [Dietzia cercidiphylli]MBB1049462.1 hypothetical protein [Dietzia cercidiphylli]HMT33716.1 hypothetical protein [Dermatophilaceae bacterium]
MTVRLCVLLWPYPGREDALRLYEDEVLPLIADHGGRLCSRDQVERQATTDPIEIQRIDFPSANALKAFMADPRRLQLESQRANSIARSDVLRLA